MKKIIFMFSQKKIKIIFFGTPEFAKIILEKMIKADYSPIIVITAPDKPVGRQQVLTPPVVKSSLMNYESKIKDKIKILQPLNVIDSQFQILDAKPDLIVLAAYNKIIPSKILKIPKYGCLNIHPSLLPKYRGASPIQTAILNGEKETGVTIILMDEKIDHGKIISNIKYQISKTETSESLSKKLAELGANLLIETLPKWITGKIKPIPQDHTKATFTKIIKKEDGHINWQNSAENIERMTRAYWPWPSAYTYLKPPTINSESQMTKLKMLKIIKAEVLKINHQKKPGEVFLTKNKKLTVACPKNALILEEIQLEGKKTIRAQDFLNGYPQIVNFVLI